MPNCAKKLSFRIFADDTNVFYSGKSIDDVKNVMNDELERICHYCAVNKLSISLKKTNFMVITSQKKKIRNIRIRNFEQKDYIKYNNNNGFISHISITDTLNYNGFKI
jgi:hypothetical protein